MREPALTPNSRFGSDEAMHPRPLPLDFVQREKEHLDAWRRRLPRFFADGAVDPGTYATAPTRLVFVLRETNEADASRDWTLAGFLRGGAKCTRPATWCNVARWTRAILTGLPPHEPVRADLAFRKDWLQWIAAVNLNKAGGSTQSDLDVVRQKARESAAELRKQIGILDPDLLVCCGRGTDDVVREVLETTADPRIVAMRHPAAHRPPRELYAELVEKVRASGVKLRSLPS